MRKEAAFCSFFFSMAKTGRSGRKGEKQCMKYRKRRRLRRELFRGKTGRGIYIKYILIMAVVLFFCLELDHFAHERAEKTEDADRVPAVELAGYLQIIPLTPEETRTLILPDMGEYLTGEDVYTLLEFLRLDELAETVGQEIPFQRTDFLTREIWCQIYERLLTELGQAEQVEITEIQYLGMLSSEGRLMADNGNYDCDPEGIDFVYGENYQVYVFGNILLGRAFPAAQQETEESGEENQEEQTGQVQIPENVSVLVTQDNSEQICRENVYLSGDAGLMAAVSGQDGSEQCQAGQVLNCGEWMNNRAAEAMVVTAGENGRIYITDESGNIHSSGYRGAFRLSRNENGIWIVNEISMEEYLYGVVPGEMPESFEAEALKAQAVCARTYASRLVNEKKYEDFGADLDDTTDCQVYLPSQENEKAVNAVNDTAGKILAFQGNLAEIYYFSTSCGFTSGLEVWQLNGPDYLRSVSLLQSPELEVGKSISVDEFLRKTDIFSYDSESRYFRWTVQLDLTSSLSRVLEEIRQEIEKGSGKVGIEAAGGSGVSGVEDLGGFQGMTVNGRSDSGTVTDLSLQFENGRVHLYHENTIRCVLAKAMTAVTDKNGELVHTLNMLPSASFSVEDSGGGKATLYGGGLGHGIGMSQYGADGMAKAGKTYSDILTFFFPGTEIAGVS